jgi:hypothetical protein
VFGLAAFAVSPFALSGKDFSRRPATAVKAVKRECGLCLCPLVGAAIKALLITALPFVCFTMCGL